MVCRLTSGLPSPTYRSQQKHHYRDAGKRVAPVTNTGTGADKLSWKAGDKVTHKKWGQERLLRLAAPVTTWN